MIYKYIVKTVGDFDGYGKDTFVKGFDNYIEAVGFYITQADKYRNWVGVKVEFVDGIAKAEEELQRLKKRAEELEKAIKKAKEN